MGVCAAHYSAAAAGCLFTHLNRQMLPAFVVRLTEMMAAVQLSDHPKNLAATAAPSLCNQLPKPSPPP